ncbi:MAG: hypothetical protein KUG77_04155 [Nannocystaceae bacterium]|nr:hypothetical protein [Nannocystaceae bacterium]
MLTRSFLTPVLCSALLTLAACDKEESLGEVESETAAESESDTASESESDSGDTEGDDACPADAMLCPDGSAVGRSGPDCAFEPCPGDSEDDSDSGDEPPPPACGAELSYQEPAACPPEGDGTPYVIDPGCYVECNPAEPACGDAEVCMTLNINPCICDGGDEGEVCCGACTAGSALCVPVVSGDVCDDVVGNYASLEEYECGITPDGLGMCEWQITLEADGGYLWMYSDLGEGGNFACKDGVITLDNNPSHSATLSADGLLVWDGIEYAKVD